MAAGSDIEWTDATWNPVVGCTPVSPGCLNCYAARMALRLGSMPDGVGQKYGGIAGRARDGRPVFTGVIRTDRASLELPKRWRKPRRVFVNSMSDLFHEAVPTDFVRDVFDVMNSCPHHTFQILTKRPERVAELASLLSWKPNVWLGTSVEAAKYYPRIRTLAKVPAQVRFLSCEPLLAPLEGLPLRGIHWVIVGGESGPGARAMKPEWVRSIRAQCKQHRVAFFFKQWGGTNKRKTGRTLEGRTWDEMPRVQLTVSAGA